MLYGRDAERAAIGGLLEEARSSRSCALVIRGEAGVGKSALLEDARERAGDMVVLAARGVESEAELPFAALHQLLLPALGRLEELPEPQAAAVGVALGLVHGPAPEPFLVFAACLSLLSEMAERRPVLCLVDDAHWLDTASAGALTFVARRLGAEGIALLFATREGEIRDFEAAGVPSLRLEGLDDNAASRLFAGVAGDVSFSVRERLLAQARGNALALVELPAALSRAQLVGEEPLPEVLPLTDQLESIFLERVRRLSDETQRFLLIAAADETEDAGLVTRAAGLLGIGSDAIDSAEQASLIAVHGSQLKFRHPLVRSAVYDAATSSERRDAHRALGEALKGEDQYSDRRAWHLAASTVEPDEEAVRALEEAAHRAAERGGHMAAAKSLARAAELSENEQDRGRRLAGAARAARIAAADDYAVSLANQALPLVSDPVLRADISCAIGAADLRRGRPLDGFPNLIEAAREVAPLDLPKAVEVLIWANTSAFETGNIAAITEVSKTADTVLPFGEGEELLHVVRAIAAFARALDAKTTNVDELEQAFVWASSNDDPELVHLVGIAMALSGDDQRFAQLNDRGVSLARARGNFGILAQQLTIRALRRAMQQRFDTAEREAGESLEFAREVGAVNLTATSLFVLGYVAAIRGEDEKAQRQAAEAFEIASAHRIGPRMAFALYAFAMLELGRGRWETALERLQNVVDPPNEGHPLLAKWALPDVIEAAVRTNRTDEARQALEAFADWTADSGPEWAHARLASCRALLTTGDQAAGYFEEALQFGPEERPFDFARMQLLFGEHLRRERRRSDSRVLLRAALETFERFRAEPWAERARNELRASGESARKRDPSTIDQLTPQELHIARLVAEGLSNKEVAAQLFLSPRTIDYHLRNVFAKLGITSRTQLARLPLDGEEDSDLKDTVGVSA